MHYFHISIGHGYAPPRNIIILFFLLWFPYIALAWYDYSYDCKDKLQPTMIPFGRYIFLPFKPPGYKQEYDKLPPAAIKDMDTLDHITLWTILVMVIVSYYYYRIRHK